MTDRASAPPGEENGRRRGGTGNTPPGSGAWLGMTAAQFQLLLLQIGASLAAGAAIMIWYENRFEGFYRRNPLLSVIFAGLALLYLLIFALEPQLWRRYRQQRRDAITLTQYDAYLRQPYFRLDPYVTATPLSFKREDDAHIEVLQWISRTTRPILFLTGASGAGKTSVLEAYVLPMLRADGVRIERLRGADDPLARLEAALASHMQTGGRLVVVYDAFEEFILVERGSDAEQRRRFLNYVRALGLALRDAPNAGVCLLLCFRREYLKAVIGMRLGEFIPGETFREIDSFRRDAARRFLEAAPAAPAPALVNRMMNGAEALDDAPGQFRPVTLNMIGLALQELGRFATGGPERLVQGYLQAALEQEEIRDVAPMVVSQMITSANTTRPRHVAQLREATGLTDTDIVASLVLLQRRGLVRRLEGPAQLWEISHDVVARQFAAILGRLRSSPWPRAAPWPWAAMYGAPVLFMASLVGAMAGVPRYMEDQARVDLRGQGVVLSADVGTGGGEKARFAVPGPEAPSKATTAVLAKAIPELSQLEITSLDLSGARGTIPSLDKLTALHTLSLAGATATIPSLDKLTALRMLDLSYARGPIPSLDKLTALHTLSLAGARGKIPSLDKLTALKTLYVSETGAPAPSLDKLRARGVQIIK